MLIITRRPGEKIVVGEDVVVQVIDCGSGGVRLGIEAPRSTRIYREEIWTAVKEENTAAAASAMEAITASAASSPKGEVTCR